MNSQFTVDGNGFIRYKTTKEDIDEVVEKFESAGSMLTLNRNTVYTTREVRLAGILGEHVFKKFFGSSAAFSGKKTSLYDLTLFNGEKIVTVDVKCKLRSVTPKPHFDASVFSYQTDFKVDYYAFLSTVLDLSNVWLCGWINKNEWLTSPHVKLWKAGDIDTINNKEFLKDSLNISYKNLHRFSLDKKSNMLEE